MILHSNKNIKFGTSVTDRSSGEPIMESQDVMADVFEAYVGGLRQEANFSESGGKELERWIRSLVSTNVFPTLDDDVTAYIATAKVPRLSVMEKKRTLAEASGALVSLLYPSPTN